MLGIDETRAELDRATEQMIGTVARLTDAQLRAPSRLPGWTRGHVVAHLARNADSVWNLLEWARCGTEVPQYPSAQARDAGIAASAGRPAAELREEIEISARRFAAQAATLPPEAWQATVTARGGWSHPAWYALNRRWREVEAHHVDLGSGYGCADWSPAYVRWELGDTLASMGDGGGPLTGRVRALDMDVDVRLGDGPQISGKGWELLGWLTGRGDGGGLATGGHPLPAAPAWPPAPAEPSRRTA